MLEDPHVDATGQQKAPVEEAFFVARVIEITAYCHRTTPFAKSPPAPISISDHVPF
jgi:hypothetical protein